MLFLTLLLFYQSLTTSVQSNQIKTLGQEIAILKTELASHEIRSRDQRE
jgi:hypothetical protein